MRINEKELTNASFLQKLALDLIKPRKSNYSEDCFNYYMQDNKFTFQDIANLRNKYDNLLKATLIRQKLTLLERVQQDFTNNKLKYESQEKCIIYLHGLGSNRMEALSIIPHLPKNYSLLTFDLSASGKSQGEFTSYGFREKQDIETVLTYLYEVKNYRHFIIWGRSMGAVSSLLFNNTLNQVETQNIFISENFKLQNQNSISNHKLSQCVKCIIADSPFCSFQNIAKDIASNKMSVPHFFTQIVLKFLENTFEKLLYDKETKINFTPFQIDFTKNYLKPKVPIIFVYSLNDEIVSCEHSQKIIKSMEKSKQKMVEKIIIPQCGHNLKRPQNVIEAIFQKIDKYSSLKLNKPKENLNTNRNSSCFVEKQNSLFQKETKNVRNKSFWNFQEQFDQTQKYEPPSLNQQAQIQYKTTDKNRFIEKNSNQQITVRKNIFERQQIKTNYKIQTSTMKRRGLSLSSTIQKIQSTVVQNNCNQQIPVSKKCINSYNEKNGAKVFRNMSVQMKSYQGNTVHQDFRITPKQVIDKRRVDMIGENNEKSINNRPSLGGDRKRILLGGSIDKKIDKKRSQSRGVMRMSLNNKNLKKFTMGSIFPAEKDSSEGLHSQNATSPDLCQKRRRIIEINPLKDSNMWLLNENFSSEPNVSGQELQYQRISSRQSLRTIDLGGMNVNVNQNLTSFINGKLQLHFDNFAVVDGTFPKGKTNDQEKHLRGNKRNESILLGQGDQQLQTEFTQSQSKFSTINIPSHMTLRPSSRLYHEKRKKKLQVQHYLLNNQQENIKMTNSRYLIED